jgi:hypothetical protein
MNQRPVLSSEKLSVFGERRLPMSQYQMDMMVFGSRVAFMNWKFGVKRRIKSLIRKICFLKDISTLFTVTECTEDSITFSPK